MISQASHTRSNLTRRSFLRLAGSAALVIGLGGIVHFGGRKDSPLRPPGAVSEESFLAVCLKCQKCSEVCPTGVITQGTLAENMLGIGTPKLDFRLAYCTFCLKCAQACPSGALNATLAQKALLGIAEIDTSHCIAWNWGGCTRCYQVCPKNAIALDSSQRPIVDSTICTGCGQCEFECPGSSLRSGVEAGFKGITVAPLKIERARLARNSPYISEEGNHKNQRQDMG